MFAMVMAGQTENSEDLQASMGYGRLFYNCTTLMIMFGFCFGYFSNVVPGAVGAGRAARIPSYFVRSVCWTLLFMIPAFLLQFAAHPILYSLGNTLCVCMLSLLSFNPIVCLCGSFLRILQVCPTTSPHRPHPSAA
jgi:Na+-driven multidrug efflux pump